MKTKDYLLRRYLIFFVGLMILSFGIALITKASLGTSAISSIPYSLSLVFTKLTLGQWTIIFNYLLLVLQVLILRKNTVWIEIFLEMAMTLVFGYCIDFCMWVLGDFVPGAYPMKVLFLLLGCAILAFGAYLEVVGGVIMLPGDAFANAIAQVSGMSFGKVRMISDVTMTIMAAVICLVGLHALIGVREGTVIAALIVGNIVRVYSHVFQGLPEKLLPPKDEVAVAGTKTSHQN